MITVFTFTSVPCVLDYICDINEGLKSNKQLSRKEYKAATLQCHQHVHSLTMNSLDSNLLYLHMGSIRHCMDFVLESWQSKA